MRFSGRLPAAISIRKVRRDYQRFCRSFFREDSFLILVEGMSWVHLGFSYVGAVYLLMLFLPNFFWTKNKPKDYENSVKKESRLLLCLERAGEMLVCCFVLIFTDFNVSGISGWSGWLGGSFALMLLYEGFWVRYFRSPKTMRDFYSSFCGIPVAGATLPVAAFLLLGIYGKNPLLLASTVILGIGHIGIHWNHYREVRAEGTSTWHRQKRI